MAFFRFLTLFFLFHSPAGLVSQDIANYKITNYTIEDGLPSNECHDIVQDSKGYIWIATDRGLVRFDGYDFKTYAQADGLLDISCLDMRLGNDDDIWILTASNRIFFFSKDREGIKEFVFPIDLEGVQPLRLNIDDFLITVDGKIVISQRGVGFYEVDISSGENRLIRTDYKCKEIFMTYSSGAEMLACVDIKADSKVSRDCIEKTTINNLEINHPYLKLGDDYYRYPLNFDYASLNEFRALYNVQVFNLGEDETLYNLYGIALFYKNNSVQYVTENQQYILSTLDLDSKELLVGEHFLGGLKLYRSRDDLKSKIFEQIISGVSISSQLKDEDGDIWCSSLENGIYKLSDSDIKVFPKTIDEKLTQVERFNDKIYFIKDRFAIKKIVSKNRILTVHIGNGEIFNLSNDSINKTLLISGVESFQLSLLEEEKLIRKKYYSSVTTLDSKKAFPVDSSNYFFKCYNEFIRYSSIEKLNVYNSWEDEGVKIRVNSVCKLQSDIFLLGTERGLKLFRGNKVTDYKESIDALQNRITAIHKTNGQYLFGVLGVGLVLWDLKGKPIIIAVENGLVSNNVEDIISKKNGEFFVCTKSGLSYLSIDENLNYNIINYTIADGLPSNEVNDVAFLRDTIYIATGSGMAYLTDLKNESILTEPIISEIDINGNKIDYTTELANLKYDQNNISISYTTLDYGLDGKIAYRYKINDLPWQESNGRVANFNLLSPGDFSFQVQSRNANNEWGPSTSLNFTIEQAVWNRVWFRALLAFLLFSILYLIYKWRMNDFNEKRKIQKEVDQLERAALQAQMNPHFIFNCLNSIQNYIYQNDKEAAMEYLTKFSLLIRKTLNASRENEVSLSEEVAMLKSYLDLEQMRLKHSFSYSIDLAKDVDSETIQIPSLLIQPFVENSIKHGMINLSQDGWIKISFSWFKKGDLQVSVKDNGKKGPSAGTIKTHKSYGSSITSKRLAFINQSNNDNYKVETTYLDEYTEVKIIIKVVE